ncbi:MAG: flagellar basal body P-ring formation protein FlgA, partial [Planctomycetes bacterium]|nr:flagellar basal body P-ring formation protein FlgA [Planctomycetota bacterium]
MRLAALALLLACALAGGEAVLRVRPEVALAQPRALLSDVAEIEAEPEVGERLAGLVVAELGSTAPVTVDARLLTSIATKAAAPSTLRVIGTGRVSRTPRSFAIPELVAAATAIAPQGARCTLVRTGSQLTVPDGPDLRLLAEMIDPSAVGEVPFRIRAMDGGRESGRTLLVMRIEREAEFTVAARDIVQGATITAQDLRRERRSVDRLTAQAAADPADLLGSVARRSIRAGEAVLPSMLAQPPAVRAGANVAVLWQGDGFSVEVQATALADARPGERLGLR